MQRRAEGETYSDGGTRPRGGGGPERADVVVVGGRCAGAALATFLARQGARVVVLERAPLHSEQVLSTHQIHPPGVRVLDELGVGDEVRAVAPGADVVRLAKDDADIDIRLPDGLTERCPRRRRLDGLLQDAAASAGAELRDRCTVTEVAIENGRARGVRFEGAGGREERLEADLVVGADGRHSTVAECVGAEEYLGYDAPRALYWTYFQAPPLWRDREVYPFGMYVGRRGAAIRTIFHTDHDQLLLGSVPPLSEAQAAWRRDPEGALLDDLRGDPMLGPLLEAAGPPLEPVRATFRERYFFRRAAGPGWLLVGDAGHHKDFVLGDGISEALLQARTAARAIGKGTDEALERWWRERDVEALPLYFLGRDEGSPEPLRELQRVAMRQVARRGELRQRMFLSINRELPAHEVLSPVQILGWALRATLSGRIRVLGDFVSMARQGARDAAEIRRRRRLLEALPA